MCSSVYINTNFSSTWNYVFIVNCQPWNSYKQACVGVSNDIRYDGIRYEVIMGTKYSVNASTCV